MPLQECVLFWRARVESMNPHRVREMSQRMNTEKAINEHRIL